MEQAKANKDIPVEVIVHWVVKDYQRMYNEIDGLGKKIEKLESKLIKREHEIEMLKRQAQKYKDKYEHIKNKYNGKLVYNSLQNRGK